MSSLINANESTNKGTSTKIILPELSYKIMGALFAAHNELGPSLLEKYYQRAVAREFDRLDISYKREIPASLVYKNEPIGKYILDFIVKETIILETKAQTAYSPKFFKQVLACVKETNLPLAILVNSRRPKLEYCRIVNAHYGDDS